MGRYPPRIPSRLANRRVRVPWLKNSKFGLTGRLQTNRSTAICQRQSVLTGEGDKEFANYWPYPLSTLPQQPPSGGKGRASANPSTQ